MLGHKSLFGTTDIEADTFTVETTEMGSATISGALNVTGATITGLGTDDVTEETNLYYTEARVSANTNVSTNTSYLDQSVKIAASPTFAGLALNGALTTTSTIDGRDVATDGTKLDGIEALADVTDTANVTSAGALMTTGGTMSGDLDLSTTVLRQDPVCIGDSVAGDAGQGANTIAIGQGVASLGVAQGASSILIGNQAGETSGSIGSVCIGDNSGAATSGDYGIYLGYKAGQSGGNFDNVIVMNSGTAGIATNPTAANQIILNAGTTQLKMDSNGLDVGALIINVTDPTSAQHAATKAYADLMLPLTGGAMTGAITTNSTFDGRDVATDGTKLDTIETNADVTDATNVSAAGALMTTGGTMSGAIAMATSKITGMGDPTLAQDAATKNYVDSTISGSGYLPLTGGTMSGDIAMATSKITFTDAITIGPSASATGASSLAIGNASTALTGGTALGYSSNADGNAGIALGGFAQANGTGTVALGYTSGSTGTQGTYNICIGSALKNMSSTFASENISIGKTSSFALSSGARNVVIGFEGALSLTTGGANIVIGSQADCAATISDQIAIGTACSTSGNDAVAIGTSAIAAANEIVLGSANSTVLKSMNASGVDLGATATRFKNLYLSGTMDITGAITTASTIDGRDVATDGAKLDGIEALADVTDATNVSAAGALMKSGGTMSGDIDMNGNSITSSTLSVLIGSDLILDGSQIRPDIGSASVPCYGFRNDANTGMWSSAADIINFSTAGVERLEIDATSIDSTVPYRGPLGTALLPAYSFTSDTNTGMWSSGADTINFSTGGTERLEIDSSGDLTINGGTVYSTCTNTIPSIETNCSVSTEGHILDMHTTMASTTTNARDFRFMHHKTNALFFQAINDAGVYVRNIMYMQHSGDVAVNGALKPVSDNTHDLGTSGLRWDDIYATNSTIQTSDENQKTNIIESDLGLDFIKELKPKKYRWKNGKRPHYGLIAQDIESVIKKRGIDFAGFVKDSKVPSYDEFGEKTNETKVVYGLRYNEFTAPMIRAIQELNEKIERLEKN